MKHGIEEAVRYLTTTTIQVTEQSDDNSTMWTHAKASAIQQTSIAAGIIVLMITVMI